MNEEEEQERDQDSGTTTTTTNIPIQQITLDNVHRFSTYELRQELKRRGFFLDHDDVNIGTGNGTEAPIRVNHAILLQKLIQELTRDDFNQNNNVAGGKNGDDAQQNFKNELERKKRERKAEAIERSKLRQANQNYFSSKRCSAGTRTEDTECGENLNAGPQVPVQVAVDEDGFKPVAGHEKGKHECGGEDDDDNEDPFALKFRPKIGGRCLFP